MRQKRIIQVIAVISIISVHFSCKTNPAPEEMENEILELHKEMIDAHISKNAGYFTQDIADSYMQVSHGEINYSSKPEIRERFDEYLNNTTFTKYEDLREPIIKVSRDGTLAWCIVQMKIEGVQKTNNDSIGKLNFVCAWITLYEKRGKKWIRLGEVDNFKSAD
jgi:hypothetical protein